MWTFDTSDTAFLLSAFTLATPHSFTHSLQCDYQPIYREGLSWLRYVDGWDAPRELIHGTDVTTQLPNWKCFHFCIWLWNVGGMLWIQNDKTLNFTTESRRDQNLVRSVRTWTWMYLNPPVHISKTCPWSQTITRTESKNKASGRQVDKSINKHFL